MSGDTDLYAESAREGDASAFSALYERVAPSLAVWADIRLRGPLRRRNDPDDVLQEVWWRALDRFRTFDPELGGFRSWIFGIANNVLLSLLRRSGSMNPAVRPSDALPSVELGAELTSITTKARRSEEALKVVEFAKTLDDGDIELFVRCGLEGNLIKEAAEVLGATPEATKKRWQRLRARMRDCAAWSDILADT